MIIEVDTQEDFNKIVESLYWDHIDFKEFDDIELQKQPKEEIGEIKQHFTVDEVLEWKEKYDKWYKEYLCSTW